MTKKQMKERARLALQAYLQYASEVNVHQTPTKGVNSGAEGRAFERAINFYMGLYDRSQDVQKQNCQDTVKYIVLNNKRKALKIEDKTGCGTLAVLDENGEVISSPLYDSDFVIYCPTFIPSLPVENQCFVLDTSVFLDILQECKLIRVKHSGYQQKRKKAGLSHYNDIQSIQSYNNSKKRKKEFFDRLSFEGLLLNDFIEYYGITIK